MQFIQQNKQQLTKNDFTFAKFMVTLSNEGGGNLHDYLEPLSTYLDSCSPSATSTERKEFYQLLVTYDEAKWICNHFWKTFTDQTNTTVMMRNDDLLEQLSQLDFTPCIANLPLLDQAVRFG